MYASVFRFTVSRVLSHRPGWSDRVMLTLGAMYCMPFRAVTCWSCWCSEDKGYSYKELPGVSSHFGFNEELNFSHILGLDIFKCVNFQPRHTL